MGMADLICECTPAIVLSHISLAWLCTAVFLKTCMHWSMPKKDASKSSMASLKSSSSPPRFVKNDILATSLTHICIWVCPFLRFFPSCCPFLGQQDDVVDVVGVAEGRVAGVSP